MHKYSLLPTYAYTRYVHVYARIYGLLDPYEIPTGHGYLSYVHPNPFPHQPTCHRDTASCQIFTETDGKTVQIEGSSFMSNLASQYGGAICAAGSDYLEITNCDFSQNEVKRCF